MKYITAFKEVMANEVDMALSTSKGEQSNVRIVNFYYPPEKEGILYFATFKGNAKIEEMVSNSKVAFTTIPKVGNQHVRVKAGNAYKSKVTIYDLKDSFIKKDKNYEMIIDQAADQLEIYEVHFKEASVVIDYMNTGKVEF